jgi:transposase
VNSKAYSSRSVNQVQLAPLLEGRAGRPMWVGVDVGKLEVQAVLHRGAGEFERPWRIANPADVRVAVEQFKRLAAGRELVVAMEPSGTYGDALRQACHDAGVVVHRVHTKVAHDYAEVFDGVPSQHDGKDAAAIAELARIGKSAPWPWTTASQVEQQIDYQVDRLDAQRRLRQTWCGRLEALLARHWPEVLPQLKLTSPTLLHALVEYGGPAALAADARASAKLKRWGKTPLTADAVARVVDGARRTVGVRQQPTDLTRVRDYAKLALAAADEVKAAKRRLLQLSRDHKAIAALASVVGNATACLLFTRLGDPSKYHCAAAYVKAMGLNLAERSSGTYKGKLKISRRGSSAVRYWLYLAALRLTKTGSPVRPWYLRKKHRDSQKAGRALVAIMRRLGLALYHVAALGETFDAKRLFPGKRRRPGHAKANAKKGG